MTDAFGRIRELVRGAVAGLTLEELTTRPGGVGNSIAWLVWHLSRVQDDHVAEVAGVEQVWFAGGWVDRFGLALPREATGYGHGSDEVAAVRASGELLVGYHEAVHEQTIRYVGGLTDADLDRIVDERWDPPVTLGVRLISVVGDDLQHSGQAAYVRGLLGHPGKH